MQNGQTANDGNLARRLAARDESALALLYDRYSGVCYSLALRMTSNVVAAESVVQDTFLILWERAPTLEEIHGSIAVFLITQTRIVAISWIQKQKKRVCNGLNEQPAVRGNNTELDLFNAPRELILKVLADLPDFQRKIIELAYFHGFTRTEIATHQGQSPGAVQVELREAISRLRKEIRKATPFTS